MNNVEAKKLHFYQLLELFSAIKIPPIQRDYAYGLTSKNYEIGKGLVESIYNSLQSKESLLLNFVYGKGKEGQSFVPIDGQQRLTTLFLFYWYIFKVTSFDEGMDSLIKFSYSTRDTTKRFCKYLCNDFDFDPNQNITEQITDCTWYSQSFANDPSVKSMIKMLEEIQRKYDKSSDFEDHKELLISDDCPVQFLWFNLENINNEDDLYIKMNSRGKQLSDFEVFKAGLEGSDSLKSILDLMQLQISDKEYISKFNNEYLDCFFAYWRKKADTGIMEFIKALVRDEFLIAASNLGVTQKEYRDYYKVIFELNGKDFFKFFSSGDYNNLFHKKGIKNGKLINEESFILIDKVLNHFCDSSFYELKAPDAFYTDYYLEESIIKDDEYRDNNISRIDVRRYAIVSFLNKFGIPKTEDELYGYFQWKRFIQNLSRNLDLNSAETTIETMAIIKKTVKSINENSNDSVLSAIEGAKNYEELSKKNFIRPQFEEESLKASLIRGNDEWRDIILDAEHYFSDGQLSFLLFFSTESGSFCLDKFSYYLQLCKKLFDSEKRLQSSVNKCLFEKALLCMEDKTNSQMGHLLKQDNSSAYSFCLGNFSKLFSNSKDVNERKKQWEIVKCLLDLILETSDFNARLEEIISQNTIPNNCWKKYFIDNDLFSVGMGNDDFHNTIYIGKDDTLLMLTKKSERSRSAEINTLLLYLKMKNNGEMVTLHLEPTGEIYEDGTARRYIEYNQSKRIYYNREKRFMCLNMETGISEEFTYLH